MGRYFLGLISGTSVDGVDAALCEFGERRCSVVAAQTFAYPPAIADRIQSLIVRGEGRLADIGAIDIVVGRYFADCALALRAASSTARRSADRVLFASIPIVRNYLVYQDTRQ